MPSAGQHVGAAGLIPRGGGGEFVLDYSYHLIKKFDIDYSTMHIFVIKNAIGQLSRLTTRLTTTYHFNPGQQTSNIKNRASLPV